MKTPTDQLLPTLAAWDLRDLRELQAALGGLIEALESPQEESTARDSEKDLALVEDKAPKRAKGHIETKYIPRGHKIHGPYLYLRYWQGGKLKSKYLGKPRG
jgi:hypothetical protein